MIKKEIDNFSHFKEKIDFISDSEIKFVGNEELLSTPEVVKKAEQA